MTVVRGDAARRLMARHRAAASHPRPVAPQNPWSATWPTAYGHEATQAASEFVVRELNDHGLNERVPDATAVVQELLDNAVQHGRGRMKTTISLTTDGRITLEVSDEGPITPALQAATKRGNIGRAKATRRATPGQPGTGLKLVALLSQAWGVRDSDVGKTVWAQLHDHDVHCRGCHQL